MLAVVSGSGGPRFIVQQGVTGFVASHEREFVRAVTTAMTDWAGHRRMRDAARQQALGASWNAVFDEVVEAYNAAAGAERRLEARAS